MSDTQVFVTPDAMTIEVIDRTSPSLEVSVDEKRVTVEGATRPVVNVSYTGGRGPIWLPGNIYDGTSLAAILAGYIGKQQLAQDLLADIDSTITGLVDARAELAAAIQANTENGTRIDDVVSRITQAEGTLELSVAKLNAAEANISNAQVFIDDASVRLSAAEGSISNASNYIATQETILSNEWTVKIQENIDGTACVAGTGLLVYPTWKLDTVYDVDDYSWFDGNAYKTIIAHTASEENVPPNSSYWQLMPYATKSQFGVLAESFFVQTGTGEKAIPFIVQDDQVFINGDLTVNGLVEAGALSSNKIWSWSVQSQNYVAGTSGYSINALTGHAEFNNINLTINYNDLADKPLDSDIYNNYIDTSNFVTTTTLNQNIAALQSQIDGGFTTWYYEGVPSLTNEPAVNWTTTTLKDVHIGDLYYDELTGKTYRFKNDTGYEWSALLDTDLTVALANAANAQDTADSKRRVFVVQPTGPYDIGDLWVAGSIVKCANANRTTGYTASEWDDAASLGAPIGTLVAGVSASTIATAATNFNLSNDRNSTAVVAPTVLANGTCVDHSIRTDGSADISFEWVWSGSAGDIDGFQVLVYQSTLKAAYTIGTTPVNEQVYTIPANKRAFILYGVTANLYYTFAVRAYRSVDKDISATGIIASAFVKSTYASENPYQPSTTVAYAGNITGTINGIAAANVNVWSSITGSGKPADSATKNVIYRQTDAPTDGTYSTGDLWIDTDASPTTVYQWTGASWDAVGNYTTTTSQLTDGANLGGTATWSGVTGTGKPSDNATVNAIYRQAATPTGGTYTTGDLWYNTGASPATLNNWNGSSWIAVANTVTNTNQITDGAGLGTTATWAKVSGTGKPANNADVTQTAIDNTVDTTTGGLIVRDSSLQRYAHLTGGDLTFYDYVDSGWIPYKSVTRTVTGVCTNGETVNIGYFRKQPTVTVSPYNLQSYAAGYYSQSQIFRLGAANLRKVGNNWFFDTIAQLNLLSGVTTQTGGSNAQALPSTTGSGVLNTTIQTGTTVSVAVIPPNITMPLNTKQVSVSLRLRQQYTFDYAGHNFQVPVAVNIEIQYLSGGGWVTGAMTTLTGVDCLYVTERNASLSFSLSTAIGVIRIVATFICYAGSTAHSTSRGTPVYNTMFAEILQITSQQEATTISASGYASYMAIG